MQINFGMGYNNFSIGKNEVKKIEEGNNAGVNVQSVQTVNGSGETVLDMGTISMSATQTKIINGDTKTVTWIAIGSYPDKGTGNDPNNNMNAADVLKLHSMNYNIR